MATYRTQLFAVTAAHLVKANHSGAIRLLASDGSMQRIPLSQGIGVLADVPDDEVDLIVYPASIVGIRRREVRRAQIINLDSPSVMNWLDSAQVSQFVVIGYPREHSEVDYEVGRASAGQVLVTGHYKGPVVGSNTMHGLEIANPLELVQFAGFSGAPVFAVEHRLAAEPVFRFAGVAVTGSASSKVMHFTAAATLADLLTTAIGHVRTFGLELAKRTRKRGPPRSICR
jgi:hypothetical protein